MAWDGTPEGPTPFFIFKGEEVLAVTHHNRLLKVLGWVKDPYKAALIDE
jgi:hypothetical protein